MRRFPALAALACLSLAAPAAANPHIGEWSEGRAAEPQTARERAALIAELRLRPQDAHHHLAYARLLAKEFLDRRNADWRPAAAAYEFALQLDPSLSAARAELGRLYAAAGRPHLAVQLLAEHVAVAPSDAQALTDLSLTALRTGDLALALWAGRKAATLSGDIPALEAAALSAGAAAAPDADSLLARLRAAQPAKAEAVARDAASWRQAATLAQASLPQPAAAAPAALPAPGSAPADWRACQAASPSASSGYPAYPGQTTQTLGPQPMAALPAPCVGVEPPMAVIEAVIVRQRDEAQSARGVNLLNSLELVARGRLRISEETAPGGQPINTNYLTVSLPDNGITYLLDILDDQAFRTEVLAKPSLVALDRTPSVFFSGATITIPISGQYSGSLQEKAVGVSLAVTPTFVSDDEMLLAVNAGRSFLEPGLEAELEQGIQTTTNSVSANVRLRFGETLVLSGLAEREDSRDSTEVPGLSRIPGLNLFLASRQTRRLRNNMVVLLTPRRPNETSRRDSDDSLLPRRYDRRLAEAVGRLARQETPEAAALDTLSAQLAAADLTDKLPVTPLAEGR
ncbi:hypothetical protein [Phenylobacterium sp.]|uniref:hypothetical protein n=1 Tax=Phenylobacterium sp. TaxID=1871053 RepID=UPI00391A4B2C